MNLYLVEATEESIKNEHVDAQFIFCADKHMDNVLGRMAAITKTVQEIVTFQQTMDHLNEYPEGCGYGKTHIMPEVDRNWFK